MSSNDICFSWSKGHIGKQYLDSTVSKGHLQCAGTGGALVPPPPPPRAHPSMPIRLSGVPGGAVRPACTKKVRKDNKVAAVKSGLRVGVAVAFLLGPSTEGRGPYKTRRLSRSEQPPTLQIHRHFSEHTHFSHTKEYCGSIKFK